MGTFTEQRECEQRCGAPATVYSGGPHAGDWAGFYCEPCSGKLGFKVWDRFVGEQQIIDEIVDQLREVDHHLVMLAKSKIFNWNPRHGVRESIRALTKANLRFAKITHNTVQQQEWDENSARLEGYLHELRNWDSRGTDPLELANKATAYWNKLAAIIIEIQQKGA